MTNIELKCSNIWIRSIEKAINATIYPVSYMQYNYDLWF